MVQPNSEKPNPVVERWQDAGFTADLAQVHWMASEAVRSYLNRRVSGRTDCDWLTHLGGRYLRPRAHRVLVLGCGDGWLERSIAPHWFIESIDAFDVAAGVVERARAEAIRQGIDKIRYGVRDLNHDRVPEGPYELIIAHSVIHHIENLELFYEGLRDSLAEDGLLLINEYVGPKRFQFTDRQMEIMNDLMPAIPERLRQAKLGPGVYSQKTCPTVEEMVAADPSEAVRSDEILEFTNRHFLVLDRFDCGGTILHHMLYDIVQNFRADVPAENAMINLLCVFEEALMRRGGLPSDFQVIAASKSRLAPLPPEPSLDGYENEKPLAPDLAGLVSRDISSFLPPRPILAPLGAHIRPIREEQNRRLTGSIEIDWIQHALDMAGRSGLRVLVVGKGAQGVVRRLETHPAVAEVDAAGRPRGGLRYDVVLGLGAIKTQGSVDSLARSVGDSGVLASIERVESATPRRWLLHLARAVTESLPSSWTRRQGFVARLRRRRAMTARSGIDAAREAARLAHSFPTVDVRPLSSRLSEYLLAECELPADPPDDAEAGLLRLIVAVEHRLMKESIVPPSIALILARR